jgi:hypothetical protein
MEDNRLLRGWWGKEMQPIMACPIEAGCNPSGQRATMCNNGQRWERATMGRIGNNGRGQQWAAIDNDGKGQ